MKFVIDEQLFTVYFLYTKFDPKNPRNRRESAAYIFKGERKDENLMGLGTALCSAHDMFSKKVGRKLAFARALIPVKADPKNGIEENIGFPPETRKKFWDTWLAWEAELEMAVIKKLVAESILQSLRPDTD